MADFQDIGYKRHRPGRGDGVVCEEIDVGKLMLKVWWRFSLHLKHLTKPSVFAQMNHVCSLASQAGRFPQEPTVEAPRLFSTLRSLARLYEAL